MRWPPMPVNALSVLLVKVRYPPESTLKIGDNLQPDTNARSVGFENCGVSATADRLTRCRRSVAPVVQLPRSKRRLSGFVQPFSPMFVLFSCHGSLMQCDQV